MGHICVFLRTGGRWRACSSERPSRGPRYWLVGSSKASASSGKSIWVSHSPVGSASRCANHRRMPAVAASVGAAFMNKLNECGAVPISTSLSVVRFPLPPHSDSTLLLSPASAPPPSLSLSLPAPLSSPLSSLSFRMNARLWLIGTWPSEVPCNTRVGGKFGCSCRIGDASVNRCTASGVWASSADIPATHLDQNQLRKDWPAL
mmetsp:Transcript_76548/g.219619  ORF Transcript_76548/g.219619 Transcript_76548/m.219619 type:complete len:204 (-) Transcript_76548:256-867(-)